MLKIAIKTKLSPEEAIKRAVEFFGSGGYGLNVIKETSTSACFEGGGGGVEGTPCAEGKGASVELVSQECDYQVTEFIGKIH